MPTLVNARINPAMIIKKDHKTLCFGFYGMVPTTLKDKLKASTVPQNKWVGGFVRPDFLNPTDPWFD
ncbi:alpha-N-acetylglucosaminidase TIM-barrel domain-containing protein, partial [Pedobacter sp. ASV12]|uniref:alpha-N-acetylglucosaminidase TIM-barrel domain-containing protein n=1 Tax=Pedobacter sp. ASV12 TaxID=2795120 RepID=UPI00351CB710